MIGKKKLAIGILIVLVLSAAGGIAFGLEKGSKRQAIIQNLSRLNQSDSNQKQSDKSVQNSSATRSAPSTPLASNLPSGVAASSIGPVEGKQGKASVIAVSDGKTFNLVLEAKLDNPPQGQFYTAWIGKSANDNNLLKLGKLTKDNDSYTISFSAEGDFSVYKVVFVTLETKDDDKSETKILAGII